MNKWTRREVYRYWVDRSSAVLTGGGGIPGLPSITAGPRWGPCLRNPQLPTDVCLDSLVTKPDTKARR